MSVTKQAVLKGLTRKLALPAALIGVLAASGLSAVTSSSVAAPADRGDVTLGSTPVKLEAFHQFNWNLTQGANGFADMLRQLRTQARNQPGASSRRLIDSNNVQHLVDVTNASTTASGQFADIVITGSNSTSIHAIVRLSNLYVVQVYYYNSSGQAHVASLASDVPSPNNTATNGRITVPEGYDRLGGRAYANRPLTDIRLGFPQFNSAVQAIRNSANWAGGNMVNLYRSVQTLIVGIAETARFVRLVSRVFRDWGTGYQLNGSDIDVMHNWDTTSRIYRNNGGGSITLYDQTIRDARTAASLLLVALGGQAMSTPHDEL